MRFDEASDLYHRLRGELLKTIAYHRQARSRPGGWPEAHDRHLAICRRQLGALRQAYRRTQEVNAWRAYQQTANARGPARPT